MNADGMGGKDNRAKIINKCYLHYTMTSYKDYDLYSSESTLPQ